MNSRALNLVACVRSACAGLVSLLLGCQASGTAEHQPPTREPRAALHAAMAAQPDRTFTLDEEVTLGGDIKTEQFVQVFRSRTLCPPVAWPNKVTCSVDLDPGDGNSKKVRYEHWLGRGKDDDGCTYVINVYWGSLVDASAWEAQGVKLPATIQQGPPDSIQRWAQADGEHLRMSGGLALVVIERFTTLNIASTKETIRLTDLADDAALFRPWYILVGRGRPSGAYGSCYIMTCDDYSATKASVIWVHGAPTAACSMSDAGDIVPPDNVRVLDACGAPTPPEAPGPPVPLRPVNADDMKVRFLLTRLMKAVDQTNDPECLR